jgi:NADH-quinone oxidoreductase subunit F
MDLHVIAPPASPAERAAVDAVIAERAGPPTTWHGGTRETAIEGHVARGGHDAREHRDLLLPALHAIQDRIGYISPPALGYVSRRLSVPPAEAYGVATFYSLLATTPRPPVVAHVCDDIACRLAGAEELCATLERSLGPAGATGADGQSTWLRSPCLGQCERAPSALLTIAGEQPHAIATGPVDAPAIIGRLEAAAGGGTAGLDAGDQPWGPARQASIRASVPQAGSDGLTLLARVGTVDPASLDAYRASGGYQALARAFELRPARVIDEMTAARLVGRGGAAFPTGRKWAAVATAPAQPHYLVCNADESEPGTFKDRLLLEEDPFALVEAMTIAAFATGAARGYLYVRGEYPLAEVRVGRALELARGAGLLGDAVMGSAFAFDIEVRRGAGAYICGEETALFESIEGKRGEPRNKPPFPVEVGLFGKPTTVNNVETLVNVLPIVLHGGTAFAATGTEGSTGSKLFCLSGHVVRPGVRDHLARATGPRRRRARCR